MIILKTSSRNESQHSEVSKTSTNILVTNWLWGCSVIIKRKLPIKCSTVTLSKCSGDYLKSWLSRSNIDTIMFCYAFATSPTCNFYTMAEKNDIMSERLRGTSNTCVKDFFLPSPFKVTLNYLNDDLMLPYCLDSLRRARINAPMSMWEHLISISLIASCISSAHTFYH